MRIEPFAGYQRAEPNHTAGDEERSVRHRAVGRVTSLFHDAAWPHVLERRAVEAPPPPSSPSSPRPPQQQRTRPTQREAALVRPAAAEAAAGGGHHRLHDDHPLQTDAHITAPLRRLHRVPGEGARNVQAGSGWRRQVRGSSRKYEAGLQGEEEADVFS